MNIKWIQWSNNAGVLKAHAIDMDDAGTPVRTITGSLVPDSAEDAADDTPRDAFSLAVIEKRTAKLVEQEARAAERSAKLAEKEAETARKAEAREASAAARAAKLAEKEATKLARATAAAEAKAAREAAKADAKATKAVAVPEEKAVKIKKPYLRIGKKVTKVVLDNAVIGEFQSDKLIEGVPHVVKVTEKSWAVYQNSKRMAMGLFHKPAAEASAPAAE